MSSDNYGIIHPHPYPDGQEWGLTMGFMSDDEGPTPNDPYYTGTYDEVLDYASTEHFEYGYSVIKKEDDD